MCIIRMISTIIKSFATHKAPASLFSNVYFCSQFQYIAESKMSGQFATRIFYGSKANLFVVVGKGNVTATKSFLLFLMLKYE